MRFLLHSGHGRVGCTVVVDLYARKVVGWSMSASLPRELALDALLMAVWRRKPDRRVVVQSDQGSQCGSDDFQRFCQAQNLEPSMSRRSNCWDKAVAESFFSSLKKERVRTRVTKPGIWPGLISSTKLRCSTTDPPSQPSGRRESRGVRKRHGVRLGVVHQTGSSPLLYVS
ncbi:hypothetical protein BH11PSE5_BH11PSE5_16550 [soil metagenome]